MKQVLKISTSSGRQLAILRRGMGGTVDVVDADPAYREQVASWLRRGFAYRSAGRTQRVIPDDPRFFERLQDYLFHATHHHRCVLLVDAGSPIGTTGGVETVEGTLGPQRGLRACL